MSESKYDCTNCPGYCCSYPVINVNKRDAQRIAKHFGITLEQAESRFFHSDHGYKRLLNRKDDEHFARICAFFDSDQRNCTIYPARPSTCRDFPGVSCGYWDFLKFERAGQKDEDYISSTWHCED